MTYAISDIHGCYDKYVEILKKINFSAQDTLYVLGDVIDRGPDGFKILLDMASRSNVIALLGNHEVMAIQALPYILRTMCLDDELSDDGIEAIKLWFYNGGETSLADFLLLNAHQAQIAWDYLLSMPLYQEIEIENQKFLLLHGGLANFSPHRVLEDYTTEEIVWCRPESNTVYYSDKCVVIGHTPTHFMYDELEIQNSPAKFFKTKTYIDIDCGCVFPGGRLGCLCLDTMEEFYV